MTSNHLNVIATEHWNFPPKFKILIIGNSGVGKSCLLKRYQDRQQVDFKKITQTLGLDFISTTESIFISDDDDRKNDQHSDNISEVRLEIWDTAGQERYGEMIRQATRGCHGILLVFALDDIKSLQNLQTWRTQIDLWQEPNSFDTKPMMGIVATKLDLLFPGIKPSASTEIRTDISLDKALKEMAHHISSKPRKNYTKKKVLRDHKNLSRSQKRQRFFPARQGPASAISTSSSSLSPSSSITDSLRESIPTKKKAEKQHLSERIKSETRDSTDCGKQNAIPNTINKVFKKKRTVNKNRGNSRKDLWKEAAGLKGSDSHGSVPDGPLPLTRRRSSPCLKRRTSSKSVLQSRKSISSFLKSNHDQGYDESEENSTTTRTMSSYSQGTSTADSNSEITSQNIISANDDNNDGDNDNDDDDDDDERPLLWVQTPITVRPIPNFDSSEKSQTFVRNPRPVHSQTGKIRYTHSDIKEILNAVLEKVDIKVIPLTSSMQFYNVDEPFHRMAIEMYRHKQKREELQNIPSALGSNDLNPEVFYVQQKSSSNDDGTQFVLPYEDENNLSCCS